MESEILLNLKCLSLEIFAISFMVFVLTSVLKLPIKKATTKFEENRRKAINTSIVFIPMFLSVMLTILYFGFLRHDWFSNAVLESCVSVYVLSVSIYAIVSKIIILIKGIKSGKLKTDSKQTKETVNSIKSDISSLINILNINKSQLSSVKEKIEKLNSLKNTIFEDKPLNEITLELETLNKQKNKLEDEILITQNQLNKEK